MYDIFKLTAVLAGVTAMTACTALGHGYSRYGDHYISAPVSHYLRPAPYASYYFAPQPYVIDMARTRFQPVPQFVYHPEPIAPRRVQFVENISRENGVMVHRPSAPVQRTYVTPPRATSAPTIRHIEIAPEPANTPSEYKAQETYVFDEAMQIPAAPYEPQTEIMPEMMSEQTDTRVSEFEYESSSKASGVDISYAKIGGGSDIVDWQACEDKTGGYVEWSPEGYKVDPAFDNCMRMKGYKPESEAEEVLAGGN